jgi:hypothetical protein
MNLPWIPAWRHPGESFWSVANKLAFVLTATVADVLDLLLGPVHRRREAIWFADMPTAAQVHRMLQVRMDHPAGHLFAALNDTPSLEARDPWVLRVRYCPDCIRGFVHRAHFQDSRTTHCEVHGRPLLDFCQHCQRALDPFCIVPWTCGACHQPLASPGRDWPHAFRQGPDPASRVQVGPPVIPVGGSTYLEAWYVLQLAYEEHAALAHVFLQGHETCAAKNEPAAMGNFDSTTFDCPVAAALMLLGTRLGLTSTAVLGGWPGHRYFERRSSVGALQYFISGFDRSQAPMAVRLAVRTWFLDCLETCLLAAVDGRYEVSWFAREYHLKRRSGQLTLEALPRLVQVAGSFCLARRGQDLRQAA